MTLEEFERVLRENNFPILARFNKYSRNIANSLTRFKYLNSLAPNKEYFAEETLKFLEDNVLIVGVKEISLGTLLVKLPDKRLSKRYIPYECLDIRNTNICGNRL